MRYLVSALALAAVAAGASWSAVPTAVGIDNFRFAPATVIVARGTEVTWSNHDDIPHSIVLMALGARSQPLDTGGRFSYRFDKAGRFNYICGLHPFMKGTVVVR